MPLSGTTQRAHIIHAAPDALFIRPIFGLLQRKRILPVVGRGATVKAEAAPVKGLDLLLTVLLIAKARRQRVVVLSVDGSVLAKLSRIKVIVRIAADAIYR